MTTREVGDRLVTLCRVGQNDAAITELYADAVVSVEAQEPMREVHGIEAVRGKGAWWVENHEVHGAVVQGPFVNGDQFAVHFQFDVTPKATGSRVTLDEIALYTVADDKIVHEVFLY